MTPTQTNPGLEKRLEMESKGFEFLKIEDPTYEPYKENGCVLLRKRDTPRDDSKIIQGFMARDRYSEVILTDAYNSNGEIKLSWCSAKRTVPMRAVYVKRK